MAESDTPLPPVEIPWRLASTTQPLSAGEPAPTAMSLFFFEPEDATLTGLFPDEKLVFIKITATVSPASFPAALSKVAADTYEGESDGLAIGKSGSQMAESLRSHSSTTTGGGSVGPDFGVVSFGGSVSNTSTDVSSGRAVSQVVDTTTRQASDERRELISHTTRPRTSSRCSRPSTSARYT